MVNKFNLIRVPRIIFGAGTVEDLPSLLKGRARNVLIITGSPSHFRYPVLTDTWYALNKEGFSIRFESIEREPSPADIDRLVERHRNSELDTLVAVGGGSVIDTGKAVSAMLSVEGSVKDYLEGVGTRVHPGIKKYLIAIPTTSGTGSEATSNAVLSETGPDGYKRSLRHENLVPDLALVDPKLTIGCPAEITAASGMDAFTQLLESYLSLTSGMFTDIMALEGIARIHASLERSVNSGEDIGARSDMAYAALLSGITLANAGLGLIHGFASSLGGFFPIPHGVICGTMMGVVNRYNIEALLQQETISATHEKYARVGKLLSAREDKDMKWYLHFVCNYIDRLTERLSIKHLSEYGITEADLGGIAENTEHKSNPVRFEKETLIQMLKERL
jgi:alcohol dehydrogenase class IV